MTLCRKGLHDKDALTPDGAPGMTGHQCRMCHRITAARYKQSEKGRREGRTYSARYRATEKGKAAERRANTSDKAREKHRRFKAKQRAAGLCSSGDGNPLVSQWLCRECLDRQAESTRKHRVTTVGRQVRRESTQRRRGWKRNQSCQHEDCLTVGVLTLVWRTEPHECYMCGTTLRKRARQGEPGFPVFDHLHPLSRGGLHCFENVMPSCDRCNRWKGERLLADIRPDLAYLDTCCYVTSDEGSVAS